MIGHCKNCNKEFKYFPSQKKGIYCSNKCQHEYTFEHINKPKVEAGLIKDGSPVLKRYLSETQGENCIECGIGTEYNGKPLVLTVDHIDGDSDNNYPINLRLLCPNCHSQTDTYKGRNKKNSARSRYQRMYRDKLNAI